MAAEVSKSSSSADSYLGSLISLTSKSEIRYEGVLYSINPEESSIGLRNVRSFGSEGRKKDGPQIPPSDRVYEFILFRGTDIKVKSSPPVQTTSSIDNDPAIIQSHYPQPSAPSATLPPAVSVSPTEVNSNAPQMVHPGANFPGGIPIYQPGASLGPWGPSPPAPTVNGNPLPMPMYWPGMYGPPNGLPHMHQQTLLQQPPGLSVPPSLQQPMQFSGFSAPPPNVPNSSLHLLTTSSSPNFLSFNPSPPVGALNVSSSSSPFLATSSSSAVPTATSIFPLSLPVVPSVSSASESPSSSVINKGSNTVLPSTTLNINLPASEPLAISNSETSSVNPPVPRKVNAVSRSSLPYPNLSQPATSIVSSSSPTEVPTPSLVTPDQLLLSGQSKTSSEFSKAAHKDVEAVQVSSSLKQPEPVLKEKESQPPILPLPSAPRNYNKSNGGHHLRHNYRGSVRGRGTGSSCPVTRFTEDFDFTAMNEKFNKDEVWGELGKKTKEGDENDDDNYEDEEGAELPNNEVKAVYNKDDFFDSLSSNTVNNTSHKGRPRFSEQLKLDAETFGESARYRGGGRGGRGFARGGRASNNGNGRGGYGYGYSGSGRGGGYGYAGGRGRGRGRARGTLSSQAS
ncbi:hypothetical protein V2J09_003825 [Rumex salicifolius]